MAWEKEQECREELSSEAVWEIQTVCTGGLDGMLERRFKLDRKKL